VLHLAAETGTGQSMYEIEHYCQVNIGATALMLDILSNQRHSVKKLVVASSRAIYGEGQYRCARHGQVYPEMRLPVDLERGDFEVKCPFCSQPVEVEPTAETARLHPASFYGITKLTQESIVMTLCPQLGIAPTALRYQNVYGPGQSLQNPYTGILSIFSNRMRAGKSVNIFEDGRESRDFVFIDDVADATVQAMLSDRANGEVFNVGSGIPTSILEVARRLRDSFQSPVEVKVSGQYRAGDIRHNYADITRIKASMGWQPQTRLGQGLARFVDWVQLQALSDDRSDQALDEMHAKGLFKSAGVDRPTD
jgi:dTDP-L-rhamnose 4-epimerase